MSKQPEFFTKKNFDSWMEAKGNKHSKAVCDDPTRCPLAQFMWEQNDAIDRVSVTMSNIQYITIPKDYKSNVYSVSKHYSFSTPKWACNFMNSFDNSDIQPHTSWKKVRELLA